MALAPAAPVRAQPAEPPRVVPVLVFPADYTYDARRLPFTLTAVDDVRAWYGRALGGVTFVAEPVVVRRSRHAFSELADSNFQAWWPLLQTEFADLGRPWNDSADLKLLMLVHGAGAWAGGDSENGGLTARDQAGRVPAGNLGGFVVIGDSSVGGLLAGVCPTDGIQRGTAWWCNWDTYRGTIAHELGHTLGLPHPDALRPPPDTSPRRWDCAVEGNTVLQCHWGFPYDSLLPYEREHLRSLRFFRQAAADAPYHDLAEQLPLAATGDVRIRRPGPAHAADAGDGLLWVDDAQGSGATGFPWGVSLPPGASLTWSAPPGCGLLAFDVGRERGTGGTGGLVIEPGTQPSHDFPVVPGAPQQARVEVCGPGTVRLSGRGEGRFRVVVGNPRLYLQER
jgi:hypothetical protein